MDTEDATKPTQERCKPLRSCRLTVFTLLLMMTCCSIAAYCLLLRSMGTSYDDFGANLARSVAYTVRTILGNTRSKSQTIAKLIRDRLQIKERYRNGTRVEESWVQIKEMTQRLSLLLNSTAVELSQPGLNPTLFEELDINPGGNKTILLWTKFLHSQSAYCEDTWSRGCHISNDRDRVDSADAVVFHIKAIGKSMAAFQSAVAPRYRHPTQAWVVQNRESPLHSMNTIPQLREFQGVFNYTSHYSASGDVIIQYGRCRPLASIIRTPLTRASEAQLRSIAAYWEDPGQYSAKKDRLVVWIVSNCHPESKRDRYVAELRQYISVDSYGLCGSKGQIKCEDRSECDSYQSIVNRYKFYLAFENSFCEEYVTEKAFKTLLPHTHVVPVVLGLGPYENVLPPGSYIDVRNFSSARDLAGYLQHLDENEAEYSAFFEWRKHYGCELVDPFCTLCEAMYALGTKKHTAANLVDLQLATKHCVSTKTFYKGLTDVRYRK